MRLNNCFCCCLLSVPPSRISLALLSVLPYPPAATAAANTNWRAMLFISCTPAGWATWFWGCNNHQTRRTWKTRCSFSSPKIAIGESKLIISLPLPSGYRDPWDRFVNSICRLSSCKYHHCFLQVVSQRRFKELPVLHWSKKIAPRKGKKTSPFVWPFPTWEALP